MFRRSPHPYLRHRDEIEGQSLEQPSALSLGPRTLVHTRPGEDGMKRRELVSQSPSESGTEADDEGCNLVKALPAPPLRPHKGLRSLRPREIGGWASPLLTPTQIDDEGGKFSDAFINGSNNREKRKGSIYHTDEEARAAKQKYLQRRRNELVRRTTETALLAGIGIFAVHGCKCWSQLLLWHRGQHCHSRDMWK